MKAEDPSTRVLVIASKFKVSQIEYLKAMGRHVDLRIAVNGEEREGMTQLAREEGLAVHPIGRLGIQLVAARLQRLIDEFQPDVVHTMYHYNDEVTAMARELVGPSKVVIHESRDPLTTMLPMTRLAPGADPWALERQALGASDGIIVVSHAMRRYFERTHDLDLASTTLVIPMCFCSEASIGHPQEKLSAKDGRTHIALDGSVTSDPEHGRYCADIIRRLVGLGLVVHSHFHDTERNGNGLYRDLASELPDYHYHETIPFGEGTRYSETVSRYDLMGVFHELGAKRFNEADLLAINMPTKALSGWLCGGIPTVSFAHYEGVGEWARKLGIGFVIERWEQLQDIAADRAAIARATRSCLEHRDVFTTESSATRVAEFYGRLLSEAGARA